MSDRSRLLILPLLCLTLLSTIPVWSEAPSEAGSEDWTQWRGPHRDGTVGGPAWPSDLKGLEQVWRVELGPGYPGPIVAKDRVFVAETHDEETEIVRALSRHDGSEIWRAEWPGEGSVPFFAASNGDWIRSTPSYDGETLYVGGMNEVLVALDAETGKQLWSIDFPALFKTPVPDFGFSSSPLVEGEHLYVQAANSLIKLNKRSGETVWRALATDDSIMVNGAFSSPILVDLAGRRQLLAQSRTTLFGVDPVDGKTLWSQEVPHFRGMNILTPVVHGDGVFTSSYRNGSFYYQVRAVGEGFEVDTVWESKVHAYMSSPVVVGGHLYMHLGNNRVTCLDVETGESRWTSKSFGKYWSKAVQGEKILALDEAGELHLLHANPGGFDLLDTREIAKSETWGHLAISGTELFVRELEAVAAYRWRDVSAKTPDASDGAVAASEE